MVAPPPRRDDHDGRRRGLFVLWGLVALTLAFTGVVVSCAANDPIAAQLADVSSRPGPPLSQPAGP